MAAPVQDMALDNPDVPEVVVENVEEVPQKKQKTDNQEEVCSPT